MAGGAGSKSNDKPGSMKDYVKWPDDTHAQIGVCKYDVEAVCSHYKIAIKDFCVCNLSNKPGDKRFALCPQWGSKGHENAKASAHTVPKTFNLKYIDKHFMEKVKPDLKRKAPG